MLESLSAPAVKPGERLTDEPPGSDNPVGAASHTRYLFLTGMACAQWHMSRNKLAEVDEQDGSRQALGDTFKCSTLSPVVGQKSSGQAEEFIICAANTI